MYHMYKYEYTADLNNEFSYERMNAEAISVDLIKKQV